MQKTKVSHATTKKATLVSKKARHDKRVTAYANTKRYTHFRSAYLIGHDAHLLQIQTLQTHYCKANNSTADITLQIRKSFFIILLCI